MERYSLIVVTDETAPIRRFDVLKSRVHRALWGAGALVALLAVGLVDYVSLRLDQPEFVALRAESAQQRERIAGFEQTLRQVNSKLEQVREFERKIRTIANLPGSAGTGGSEITEATPDVGGDLEAAEGGEVDMDARGGGDEAHRAPADGALRSSPATGPGRVSVLRQEAERLGIVASSRELSLKELVERLEDKHRRLASSPAIWPTKGWLTSRFGYRTSPFTGRRQFHAGIDIAGAHGTDVVAPARGKVIFSGARGPLGNSLTIDHGYGVRTFYGHLAKAHVKKGEEVERGQTIASLGDTGRSTGPHLHYTVEVGGKPRNPLDYIFD